LKADDDESSSSRLAALLLEFGSSPIKKEVTLLAVLLDLGGA
jgi:hypothetical protein